MFQKLRCVPGDGLGNTFLIVMQADLERIGSDMPALAAQLCNECDGLLLVGPSNNDRPMSLRIINRDGSDGGICFNGLRVAALWTHQKEGAFVMDGHHVEWQMLSDNVVELHLQANELSDELTLQHIHTSVAEGIKVPFWNPHAVFPMDEINEFDLQSLAIEVRAQVDLFPDGVNVELIAPAGERGLQMRVDERGVGETQACGSGAVAVALLAWAQAAPRELAVSMPGGIIVLSPASGGGILLAAEATLGEAFDAHLSL